ncbi:UDP-N-acetylmuramate:L-alanyl-gamma-D-glutamyl-meso-diaminopimelate ligase [Pseudidiomarina donghaiensis]|uniref:UDP-N-acetylmuramate--L-alanyl-gamma-D-glutamyl-meso-2,6-diaminoheptandioate ligase n=1 Tax=Pseudidiomarina donghaiensis TaxID=519452 RepID=A0A432XG25_9GAMM|nr:UDP-N-acetylmuramate:L-alanyl-gamma-D-glutamyl-meso-diaminopimelate ligase [Pseudidiomarina donghaiensis]RUO47572.1 UDP-N-acetylmuramate:L-alanyl-gamma-D-glutamyl-meso-diaminopimelate ligase [Pseudidiomarina donghaiensis]SFV22983.1 UDP-N-acetylmuramate: L-alanyl-gamma-D-glutamyl-meso-diaminopimelate ligase [Pseudidiomarina donghaiensis]
MHIHILGICGTFMGGIAALAKGLGHHVTGSDAQVYPPMSDQLRAIGIELIEGYDAEQLSPRPDLVIIGNALSRGNSAVEAVLNQRIPYTSGAQWLHDELLQHKWVLAVAGTHGKTTTSSMLTWLLEFAGLKPGFLVGGVLANFQQSARLGESDFFVIEADEYDTAFFDKRSKFVHYCPSTLVLNNLEFDHADIFADLAAIQRQFHHLVRVVPGYGRIFYPQQEAALEQVIEQGCWSETVKTGPQGEWSTRLVKQDGSVFDVLYHGELQGQVRWDLIGDHNVANGLMAIAAAHHVGVPVDVSCEALLSYQNTKRRLELRANIADIAIYDDFAHHPTAITTTLKGMRAKQPKARIVAVLEPRSNTMKLGTMADVLDTALSEANEIFMLQPDAVQWRVTDKVPRAHVGASVDELLVLLSQKLQPGDQVVIMSNGGFGNIHNRLIDVLRRQYTD